MKCSLVFQRKKCQSCHISKHISICTYADIVTGTKCRVYHFKLQINTFPKQAENILVSLQYSVNCTGVKIELNHIKSNGLIIGILPELDLSEKINCPWIKSPYERETCTQNLQNMLKEGSVNVPKSNISILFKSIKGTMILSKASILNFSWRNVKTMFYKA